MKDLRETKILMIEIFSHDLSFKPDEETEGIFIISGFDWENEPFHLYLKENEAKNLIWQMTYYVSNPEYDQ